MARCLRCLHCDVCDSDRNEKERKYGDCSDFLSDYDVVSREEVDRLRSILDSYALQYGTVKDQHEVIDRLKRETAREIFGEIESILYSAFVPVLRADLSIEGKKLDGLHIRVDDYNTIKKKYTEGDGDG